MQQFRNPFDRVARFEQFADDPETKTAENFASAEHMEADRPSSADRTIEIVEENEAAKESKDTQDTHGDSFRIEPDPMASEDADWQEKTEEQPSSDVSSQDQNASSEAASSDDLNQDTVTEEAPEQDKAHQDESEESPKEESIEGDVQYTGPLFGGAAAQAESEELAALKAEMDAMRLRQAAEMDNFKKRLAREHQEQMLYASEKVLSDLLPTLDNLELALQYGNTNEVCKDILTGVSMTHKLLLDCVQKHGLIPVGAVGEVFDPAIHEAVGFDPQSDQEKGCVARVLQRGYKLGNRLLRAARVMISQPAG